MKNFKSNLDPKTVDGFGDEWSRLDQTGMTEKDTRILFDGYFDIFPWGSISNNSIGFDLGCGSGRWAKMVLPRVKKLHCIDPSVAIEVAQKNLTEFRNCEFHKADVDNMPLEDGSMDFGYSLGVLHHIPNTHSALSICVKKLKQGAPFLLYLYYSFDNRPLWFRSIWKFSEIFRAVVSRMPFGLRYFVSQVIAIFLYWPIARLSKLLELIGFNVHHFPLSSYRNLGFYVMRTDALDRFGTRLEKRFARAEIQQMMESAGLENIIFSTKSPYWCAIGFAKAKT